MPLNFIDTTTCSYGYSFSDTVIPVSIDTLLNNTSNWYHGTTISASELAEALSRTSSDLIIQYNETDEDRYNLIKKRKNYIPNIF